jgi:hypothetical protein
MLCYGRQLLLAQSLGFRSQKIVFSAPISFSPVVLGPKVLKEVLNALGVH